MPSRSIGLRHNIRTRLLLFVLLPFVLIIIGSGWYSLRTLELIPTTGGTPSLG